jgi:hypothetical protein
LTAFINEDPSLYQRALFSLIGQGKVNTAPTFVNIPPDSLSIPINSAVSYPYQDLHGNPITVVVTDENGTPAYAINTGASLGLMATDFSMLGTHSLSVKLSDRFLSTIYNFSVTFTNSAPKFTNALLDQTIANNVSSTYTLPPSNDMEGNDIIMTLNPSTPWATLDGSRILFNQPPLSAIGNYQFSLILSDGNA